MFRAVADRTNAFSPERRILVGPATRSLQVAAKSLVHNRVVDNSHKCLQVCWFSKEEQCKLISHSMDANKIIQLKCNLRKKEYLIPPPQISSAL